MNGDKKMCVAFLGKHLRTAALFSFCSLDFDRHPTIFENAMANRNSVGLPGGSALDARNRTGRFAPFRSGLFDSV